MKPPAFWKTWAALLVCAGLFAYVYFVESKREEKPEKPKEKVFALDKSKVEELVLTTAAGEEVRVVTDGAGWRLVTWRTWC